MMWAEALSLTIFLSSFGAGLLLVIITVLRFLIKKTKEMRKNG